METAEFQQSISTVYTSDISALHSNLSKDTLDDFSNAKTSIRLFCNNFDAKANELSVAQIRRDGGRELNQKKAISQLGELCTRHLEIFPKDDKMKLLRPICTSPAQLEILEKKGKYSPSMSKKLFHPIETASRDSIASISSYLADIERKRVEAKHSPAQRSSSK